MNLTIVVHQMSIRLELCRVGMELIHRLIKLVAVVHIMSKMGHTLPEKHMTVGMYMVGIKRLNEEVLKWKLTKKKR